MSKLLVKFYLTVMIVAYAALAILSLWQDNITGFAGWVSALVWVVVSIRVAK